jgi:hypothetical protein
VLLRLQRECSPAK